MRNLWLHHALSRVQGYRAKLVGLAAAAMLAPSVVAAWQGGASGALAVAGLLGGLALIALAHLLRPIGVVSSALRKCAEPAEAVTGDEARRMLADMAHVANTLDAMRQRLSHRHPVSGLPTREPFLAALAKRSGPDTRGVLGVIRFVDYDDLAAFDQDRADKALRAFAGRLRTAVQAERLVAQVDRDCFAIWFDGAADREGAAVELQAIGYVLAQDIEADDVRLSPEVGLGAATLPDDAVEPAALLTRAFAAAPKAGRGGTGKVAFFSAEVTHAARERFQIEQGLRTAIAHEELALHYQPVFDASAGTVIGAEALLRWRHPELGVVSPARFVPVLEQSGLMDEVGLWVLNAACRQVRSWQDQGLTDLKVAVNLSPRQCRDPGLAKAVARTLNRHGVSAAKLEVELTETAAMEDAARTRTLLAELRELGVSVALDDFGAGYSSLSYLKNLPFSKLKIDREFVERVDERRDSQAICAALVELTRRLEIEVLAEGVEREAEVDTLRQLGCPLFQGYLFSPPLPAAEFATLLVDRGWRSAASSASVRKLSA
jgi:Amt family ammonium transporter